MVSSDTSVLDCNSRLATEPNSSPLKGVDVLLPNHCSSLPPARFFRPCSRLCMPNRNSASPPNSGKIPVLSVILPPFWVLMPLYGPGT